MKRFVVLLLALTMIFALAACGGKTTECEVCGETKTCHEITVMGETGWVCSDCEKLVKGLADLADDLAG